MHVPQLVLEQQTPSTQLPLLQLNEDVQAAPSGSFWQVELVQT